MQSIRQSGEQPLCLYFSSGKIIEFYKQLIHLNSSFPKVIPNLFKLFWEKLERGIYMASQTNVREMIAKNNAKRVGQVIKSFLSFWVLFQLYQS